MNIQEGIEQHVQALLKCELCQKMKRPAVSGKAVVSEVMLVGQAPGVKEPIFGKPFAWTAGKTLFKWFREQCGVAEEEFRSRVYMAAVCRCFPGKNAAGGDRVPDADEIQNCLRWMRAEIELLRPRLMIPVGKLAIGQFLEVRKLDSLIGNAYTVKKWGHAFDVVPLPHPSGASPWHRVEPGKTLLAKALRLIAAHPAWRTIRNA
jgi:uracil-DNA glycosylase